MGVGLVMAGNGSLVRLVGAESILLGPEGTTTPAVPVRGCGEAVASQPGCCFGTPGMTWSSYRLGCGWCCGAGCGRGSGGGVVVVGWLLVENCTVDASILFSVVKLSRADGGCLGTRSR